MSLKPIIKLRRTPWICQFFLWQTAGVSRNSVQYNVALANGIAQTIIALIFLVIIIIINLILLFFAAAAPGLGTAIVLFIYLLDAIKIFRDLIMSDELEEFLTTRAYDLVIEYEKS